VDEADEEAELVAELEWDEVALDVTDDVADDVADDEAEVVLDVDAELVALVDAELEPVEDTVDVAELDAVDVWVDDGDVTSQLRNVPFERRSITAFRVVTMGSQSAIATNM
jgi:hypothetical protein